MVIKWPFKSLFLPFRFKLTTLCVLFSDLETKLRFKLKVKKTKKQPKQNWDLQKQGCKNKQYRDEILNLIIFLKLDLSAD